MNEKTEKQADRQTDTQTHRYTDGYGWMDGSVDRKTVTIAPVPTVIFAVTSPVIRDTQFVRTLKPVTEVARLIQSYGNLKNNF